MRVIVTMIPALIFALAAAAAGAAEVYTWRDKDGNVHYSDIPPTGGTESRKLNAPTTPSSAGDARKNVANQEMEFRRRQTESAEALAKTQKEKSDAEIRRTNCEQARTQLAGLESGQRLVRFNAQGEREYLDDDQRAQEIDRSRKALAEWCK